MSPLATTIFMIAAIVALSGLDWLLDRDDRDGNTYSERFRALGAVWPPARLIISFAFGVLAAHWWRW